MEETPKMPAGIFSRCRFLALVFVSALFLYGCGGGEDSLSPGGGTALNGTAATGESLFTSVGCNACHGADASGNIGPNIQGDSADMILGMAGTGPMASISVTEQEAYDLSAYLATIDTDTTATGDGGDGDGGGALDGESLFTNPIGSNANACSDCHGSLAEGFIGPALAASTRTAAGIDPVTVEFELSRPGVVAMMSNLSFTEEEATAIVAWLATL